MCSKIPNIHFVHPGFDQRVRPIDLVTDEHIVVEFPVTYVAIYRGCLVFAFIITESIEHWLEKILTPVN